MAHNTPEYQAQWRAEHPEYLARQRQRQEARRKAVKRLIDAHPDAFAHYLATELAKYGLEPKGGS